MSAVAVAAPAAYYVQHSLPGRLRVRIEELRLRGFADRFTRSLASQPGVISIRVNRWCSSAILSFDPRRLDERRLRELLDQHIDAGAVISSPNGHAPVVHVAAVPTHARPFARLVRLGRRLCPAWLQLALGGAAIAASVVRLPSPLSTGLLVASLLPILGRTVRTFVEERRIGVDALDSVAALLMVRQGSFRTAGFMAALVGLGEFIRDRTARRSAALMVDLRQMLGGRSTWVVRGNRRERVAIDAVAPGDTVIVYPGDMVPVDGEIVRGQATIDQRSLTGESMPADVGPGDPAYASTVVVEGKLYIRCHRAGMDTRAGALVGLLQGAPVSETRAHNYAASLADRLVLPIFATAGVSALLGGMQRGVSVLIFDFATGIRISAPTAILTSMQRAAHRGILIKDGAALEKLAAVDAVIFDKTGTLTRGEPVVTDVLAVNGLPADELLALAASAEQRLRHPAAHAIVRHARARSIAIPDRMDSNYVSGMGVLAHIDDRVVLVGSRRLMEWQGISMAPIEHAQKRVRARGESLGYVAVNGELAGLIAYADPPRDEAANVVAQLRRRGVREIIMVTGDNAAPASSVARLAGIDAIVANAFPERKVEVLKELQRRGRTVAVVGDGINDSPALSHADVAISLKGGTDLARDRASVVLTDDSLDRLPEAIDVARRAMSLVRQNIVLTAIPNAAGIALAALGLIGPGLSTLLNNGSAIVASLNSLRPAAFAPPALPSEQAHGV